MSILELCRRSVVATELCARLYSHESKDMQKRTLASKDCVMSGRNILDLARHFRLFFEFYKREILAVKFKKVDIWKSSRL